MMDVSEMWYPEHQSQPSLKVSGLSCTAAKGRLAPGKQCPWPPVAMRTFTQRSGSDSAPESDCVKADEGRAAAAQAALADCRNVRREIKQRFSNTGIGCQHAAAAGFILKFTLHE